MATTLLSVDDDVGLLKAIARILRREPFEAVFVDNPCAALELCKQRRFDVVLSDFNMPKMNGVELLRGVRALSSSSMRLLLTAHPDDREIRDALRDGTVGRVLEKPFRLDVLVRALRDAAAAGSEMAARLEHLP